MHRSLPLPLLLLTVTATFGCSASYPTAPAPIPVVAVRISSSPALTGPVPTGRRFILSLAAVDSDRVFHPVNAADVTWFTSDSTVVRPGLTNSNDFVTVGSGTASMYGSYKGFTNSLEITVSSGQ